MPDLHDDLSLFAHAAACATPLSAAGHARRQTMRAMLLAEVERRRRTRHAVHASVAVTALAAGLALAARLLLRVPEPPAPAPAGLQLAHADFATVEADGARLAEICRPPRELPPDLIVAGTWPPRTCDFGVARTDEARVAAIRIDDDEVLHLLAAAARPTGLVRSPAGVYFTGDVFDK